MIQVNTAWEKKWRFSGSRMMNQRSVHHRPGSHNSYGKMLVCGLVPRLCRWISAEPQLCGCWPSATARSILSLPLCSVLLGRLGWVSRFCGVADSSLMVTYVQTFKPQGKKQCRSYEASSDSTFLAGEDCNQGSCLQERSCSDVWVYIVDACSL